MCLYTHTCTYTVTPLIQFSFRNYAIFYFQQCLTQSRLFSLLLCNQGWPWTFDLLASTSLSARFTAMYYLTWFMWCWGLNPGFVYARQALYQLGYTSKPFPYYYGVTCFLWRGCPEPGIHWLTWGTCVPPSSLLPTWLIDCHELTSHFLLLQKGRREALRGGHRCKPAQAFLLEP